MQGHLLPARVKHEFHYAFKFFSPTVFNFDFHKIERAFCELYRETFERGACEACL